MCRIRFFCLPRISLYNIFHLSKWYPLYHLWNHPSTRLRSNCHLLESNNHSRAFIPFNSTGRNINFRLHQFDCYSPTYTLWGWNSCLPLSSSILSPLDSHMFYFLPREWGVMSNSLLASDCCIHSRALKSLLCFSFWFQNQFEDLCQL